MPPKGTTTVSEIRKTLDVLTDKINDNHLEVIKELNDNQIKVLQRITVLETKINPMPIMCEQHSTEIKNLAAEQNKAFGRRSIIQVGLGSGFVLFIRELLAFVMHK